MGESVADRPLNIPHGDRLSPSHPAYREILDAHSRALRRGSMSYVDPPTGLSVLTAAYLQERGSCCDSGCRHCPYVP
jgi:Family of unknown function (DUF5522)